MMGFKDYSDLKMVRKCLWEYRKNDRELYIFTDKFKEFISKAKTERETINYCIELAKIHGFMDLDEAISTGRKLKEGDKVYKINRDKGAAFFVIGSEIMTKGFNLIAAHTDCPRLDIKPKPLYEDSGYVMLDTHYYGSIKKYQWIALPLALHGIVIKKDGEKIQINIGEESNDPVFYISDLLIHLSQEQMQKNLLTGISGEDLNIVFGSIPSDFLTDEKVKHNILNILNERYKINEEDLVFAELEAVPSGVARDSGLDKSMVMAYGQDDRVGVFTSLSALLGIKDNYKTSAVLLVDKEETGNFGGTGAHSKFFEQVVSEILDLTCGYNGLKLLETLRNSKMLSVDGICAYDSNYSSVFDINNTAYLGYGVVINKYNGVKGKVETNDASPEFLNYLRSIFYENDIIWQHAEFGKVDGGGSETISYILGQYGAEAGDISFPILGMHSPFEITSKADIYELYRACEAFFQAKSRR